MNRQHSDIDSQPPTAESGGLSGIAMKMAIQGWVLRARGADIAFHTGVIDAIDAGIEAQAEIFTAQHSTPEAMELAAKYHPAWDKCKDYDKRLHARNGFIVLGADLRTPVEYIFCWTPGGRYEGGTAQALRIADGWNAELPPKERIKILNLGNEDTLLKVMERL